MAYDSQRRLAVLFGGSGWTNGNYTPFNDLWEWNGAHWVQRMAQAPATNGWARNQNGIWQLTYTNGQPVGRFYAPLDYDSRRGRMILFGGTTFDPSQSQVQLGDTWEWDGAQWYFRTTNGPSPRFKDTMAFDSNRGLSLLYGGFDTPDGGAIWNWNGLLWNNVVPPGGPAHNYSQTVGSMVYDTFRRTIFFGPAEEGYGEIKADFWNWDGTNWTGLGHGFGGVTDAPYSGGMVFDAYRRRSVYFGGEYENPTASWDGGAWILLTNSPSAPTGRSFPAMAYDSFRHAVLMTGGEIANLVPTNDTWELIAVDVPLINGEPASEYVPPGGTASFLVDAVGPPGDSLTFAWFKDGAQLSDGGRISGSTSTNLQIAPVTAADAGKYSVQISCACGSTKSLSAILTLDPSLQLFTAANTGTLVWSAPNVILEQADSPAGPWTPVANATSPFDVAALGGAKFFRLAQTNP
jgi:hypothetical protein